MQQAKETGSGASMDKALMQLKQEQVKIKEIAFDLALRIMQTQGLSAALDDLLTSIRVLHRYKITVTGEIDDTSFNTAKSVHVYRIIREALNNILKHADAGEIRLGFSALNHYYHFTVADNGKGFDVTKGIHLGSGLQNLRSRAKLLTAGLMIQSVPGKGTTIKLKVLKENVQK